MHGSAERMGSVLQTFHREVEQIESIKRVVQFPKLEPPPADFLVQMENYAREAPRSLDDVQSKKVPTLPRCTPVFSQQCLVVQAMQDAFGL